METDIEVTLSFFEWSRIACDQDTLQSTWYSFYLNITCFSYERELNPRDESLSTCSKFA